ncbi:MAG TPA: GDSL-type esterase/lipase family protein [Polyangiaceae bacterium]|nr:GDSL-type esterase/lipase family protein [Polyangiaceae bacterium]
MAALTLGLAGPVGCSSDPEPAVETGGSASAGSPATTAGSGLGGTPNASGGASNAGSGGSNASAGTGQQPPAGGTPGAAGTTSTGGVSTAGSSTGGSSTTAGSGSGGASGSAGAGTGGAAGGGTQPIKVWLAGDSTVQNCSGTCPCGWGSQFDALFNDKVTVVNSAVGGRSIQTWLYEAGVGSLGGNGECTLTSQTYDKRWTAMLDANTGMKPGDFLFIQFGINDGAADCPRHVGIELFKRYLGTMAKAAKDRGAQPVFVTPVSAIICSGAVAQPSRGKFVDATKAAATTASVPLLDLHQLSINRYNTLGFCPNDENWSTGKVGAFFCEDHTHFEAAGAKDIASLVAGALTGPTQTLAQYLK